MQLFVPDWLDPLRERLLPRLKDNSLTVDARTRLNIEAWLNAAQERTLLTDDPRSAQGALRSIVSKSARDQEVFDRVSEFWCSDWKREEEAQDDPKVIDRPRKLKKGKPDEERTVWHQQFLALVAIVIGMIVVVWLMTHFAVQNESDLGKSNSNKELSTVFGDISTKTPIPDFEVVLPLVEGQTEVQLQTPPWLFGLHPLFYVLLVILLASAGFFTHYTRKTQLARIATREHLREQEVFVRQFLPVSGKRRAALRVAARLLRKPSPTESKVLDIHASTHATAIRAGLFLPVYRIRVATPEYVWLVDRASSGDQLAHWAAEMARDLAAEGVVLTLYEFDRDPRWVAPLHIYRSIRVAAPQRYVPLSSLVAGHLGQGMFILADGHDFIDPMRGELYGWLESAFMPWPRRVLMTPRPLASWGAVEDMLAGEGLPAHADSFLVLPAQIDSLAAAAKWLLGNGIPEISPLPGAPAVLPSMLQYDDTRWLGRDPPAATEMVMLVEQLRAYLGSTAYTWLAASAAYPHLSADLTAYLAQQLTDSPLLDIDAAVVPSTDVRLLEARLVAIAQLPWCRQALMPDWLRRALLLSLPLGSRERVRQVLGNLLSTATSRNEISGLSLGVIASENPDRTRKNLLQRFHRLILEIGLHSVIEGEPIESPLRDVIYLGVLYGDFESELTLDAPEEFARAAGAEIGNQLTLNPMRWLAAGMMIAVFSLLWFHWWARAQYQAARSKIETDHADAEEIATQQLHKDEVHRNATKGERIDAQSKEEQDTQSTGALVFLSYDHTETAVASAAMALRDRLVRELGSGSVWDDRDLPQGELVSDWVRQSIDNCVIMVAFIDRHGFANSQWRNLEVSRALATGKIVFPILLDEAYMPLKKDLPIDVRVIADKQAFRQHTDKRMHEDIAQLTERIVQMVENAAVASKKATRSASE